MNLVREGPHLIYCGSSSHEQASFQGGQVERFRRRDHRVGLFAAGHGQVRGERHPCCHQWRVDLVADDPDCVFGGQGCHGGQLGPGRDRAVRVVRVAQQERLDLVTGEGGAQQLQVESAVGGGGDFHCLPASGGGAEPERRVDGGVDDHFGPRAGELVDQVGHPRYHVRAGHRLGLVEVKPPPVVGEPDESLGQGVVAGVAQVPDPHRVFQGPADPR